MLTLLRRHWNTLHRSQAPDDMVRPAAMLDGTLGTFGFWCVALSGIGLYAFARTLMSGPIAAITLFHLGGGIAFTLWLALRRPWAPRHAADQREACLWASVVAASATGCLLIIMALLGRSVGTAPGLFYLHLGAGIVASAAAAWRWRASIRGPGVARIALAALVFLAAGITLGRCYDAEEYYRRITSTNSVQAKDALFPSGAEITRPRDWRRAVPAGGCTRTGCHEAVGQSWRLSAHFFSTTTPTYLTAEAYALRRDGAATVRWCRGCHAPLQRMAPSERGVGCLTCHAMCRVPDAMGNGSAWYAPPAIYPFAGDRGGAGRWTHDFLLRVRPEPHRFALRGPSPSPAAAVTCLPCHRLGVNIPQNHYRYLHYDDTWMDWQNGPWSGRTLHTFEAAPSIRSCTDCHSSGVRVKDPSGSAPSHAFGLGPPIGADSMEERLSRLKQSLHVEIFAVKAAGDTRDRQAVVAAPAGSVPVAVAPGEQIVADVLVESRGIGHAFPTGEPDLSEMWLDLRILTPSGRVVLQSGLGPAAGFSGRDAHTYGLVALDREAKRLHGANVFEMVASAYQRVRGTGQADPPRYRCLLPDVGDVARYRLRVPGHAGGSLIMDARLWYRPVNRVLAAWVLNGAGRGARAAKLTRADAAVVAEHRVTLRVGPRGPTPAVGIAPRRWFAYGAALLVQKDTARARAAFQVARDQAPSWPDAWIALGRAYLEEGDLLAARSHLLKAMQLEPNNLRAQVWLGRVYRLMGRYDEALRILRPLARDFPMDRLTWLDIGLCLLQRDQLAQAAEAFRQMLNADPNDAVAHFNLMQCSRRLLHISDARREEVIYRILQESDAPVTLLQNYARAHPEEYRESQPIHEHILTAPNLQKSR
ncbi:MAG: tetratricopeptide repeat protein [Chthonomonadales bacterium]